MKFIVLYLLLLKATLTSFSGLAGLPVLRDDLVLQHHMLTDRELNQAVAIGRVTPGPKGSYIMSVGYYAGGIPGGIAAWLALVTPAILIIPMLSLVGRYTKDPRVQRTLRAVVLASAGISLSATLPLGADALTSPLTWALAVVSLGLLVFTKLDTTLVMLASGLVSLAGFALLN
jgi:chromate transporter